MGINEYLSSEYLFFQDKPPVQKVPEQTAYVIFIHICLRELSATERGPSGLAADQLTMQILLSTSFHHLVMESFQCIYR